MLTEEGCKARRARLFERLPEETEWALIGDPRHLMYLANFWVQPLSFSFSERALLLLRRGGPATIIGDNFTTRSAATEAYADDWHAFEWYTHKKSTINRDHAMLKALGEAAADLPRESGLVEAEWAPLGVESQLGEQPSHVSADGYTGERSSDVGTVLRSLRRQKDADEVDLMRACMRATEAGHAWARENVAPGRTDLEMYLGVQSAAIKAAGRPALVYGDFRKCSPSNPKQGGLPAGETLQAGDTYVLDYSVMLDGYRSDFTNTMAVGDVSDAVRSNFATCRRAMEAGEEVLAAGVPCRDVYAAVKEVFNEAGIGDSFHHHAGHGLGLGHPEWPTLVPESTDTLLPGDVVTLEPGSYVEGVGGMRIEHNYLVTDDGYERLSDHTIALDA